VVILTPTSAVDRLSDLDWLRPHQSMPPPARGEGMNGARTRRAHLSITARGFEQRHPIWLRVSYGDVTAEEAAAELHASGLLP
jgi:hypothetical protein